MPPTTYSTPLRSTSRRKRSRMRIMVATRDSQIGLEHEAVADGAGHEVEHVAAKHEVLADPHARDVQALLVAAACAVGAKPPGVIEPVSP